MEARDSSPSVSGVAASNTLSQPQTQVNPIGLSGPISNNNNNNNDNDLEDVENKTERSVSSKRSMSRDQAFKPSKRARHETATSHRSLSPQGTDYPRGTSTVQAQNLDNFKSDMTSLIKDMIQSFCFPV